MNVLEINNSGNIKCNRYYNGQVSDHYNTGFFIPEYIYVLVKGLLKTQKVG